MSDIERTLGRLEGKLDSHIKFGRDEHEKINQRFDVLEEKVDSLRLTRARITGISTVVGASVGWLLSQIGLGK